MKLFLVLLLCIIGPNAMAQTTKFNQKLADSLGSDQYGMKSYVFVILRTGENKTADKALVDSLFKGHMDNIDKLVNLGKLVVAGPFGKNDNGYRGLFILNAKTMDEARALINMDPAIKNKLLDAELIPWYGSAALPLYLPFHDKIQKTTF